MAKITVVEKQIVDPSSTVLDMHLAHILNACRQVIEAEGCLRDRSLASDRRDEYEADLYAAITHLANHVPKALSEWDRVTDSMPDADESSS